jgi:cysteine desulfurase
VTARRIYLDAHATTPVDPRVLAAMLPYFQERFGNASSRTHTHGREAEAAVEGARAQAAAAIGGSAKEIVWTSGATEADNLALLGACEAYRDRGDHVVTCVTEHPAVLDSCRHLESRGFRVTYLPVSSEGELDLAALAAALGERTILVSIMTANNEVGTVHPIEDIARLVHEKSGALFHTDAVQAIGRVPVDVEKAGIDLLSISAHKIYGPKGVGALWVRRRRPTVRLAPILHGGGHERGFRSGTLNVPGIVGLGSALQLAAAERESEAARVKELRDRLWNSLRSALPLVHLNGHPTRRLPNNLNASFEGVEAEDLLRELPYLAISTGAACSSASPEPSHVLTALGLGTARAQSSLRFGLTRFTTEQEIDAAAAQVIDAVRKLRAISPSTETAP